MRILFHDFEIPDLLKDNGKSTGGACVRINAFSIGLTNLGHDVGILTWKGANDFVGKDTPYELVETFPAKGGIKYVRKIYYNFYKTLKATRRFNPDIIFSKGNSMNSGILAVIAKLLKCPLGYIVTNDKDVDERVLKDQIYITQKLFQFMLRNADLIICQNSYQLDQLKMNYPKSNFKKVHNPYYFSQALPEVTARVNRGYIAWVGIFSYQKNLPALLAVARKMPGYQFKIAGSIHSGTMAKKNGTLDIQSVRAIEHLEKMPNVEFVGFLKRSQILDFLSRAFVLLNTSHYEGFSNTFLESFAAGTPVVTLDKIDPDDIIETFKLGATVNNVDQFPETISNFIDNDSYEDTCNRCRTYLETNHSIQHICTELEKSIYSAIP